MIPGVLHADAIARNVFRVRAGISFLVIVLATLGLTARYSFLQIHEHQRYTTRSEANRLQLRPIAPGRGLIYDRNGVLLADNRPAFRLEIIPEQAKNLGSSLDLLSTLIGLTPDDIRAFRKQVQARRPFDRIPLSLRLSDQQLARLAVNRYRLPGVEVTPYLMRYYPLGQAFTHVLGYVGRINSQDIARLDAGRYAATSHIGKAGIEKRYESELHGEVGVEEVETNAQGRLVRSVSRTAPTPGQSLTLTLDARLQQTAIAAMADYTGAVVALDPRNGEVLALISEPGFDPNLFASGIDRKAYAALLASPNQPLFNRALKGRYEPGSTIKPFVALAGLETGVDKPGHTLVSYGYYQLPGQDRRYHDWKIGGHGKVDVVQAITQSVNTYFYDLAVRLGIDRMSNYLKRFGFGEKTGIDLPGEAPGVLASRQWKRANLNQPWYLGETVISGIGQGFTLTTPIQLATATAILANGGHYIRPHLLKNASGSLRDPVEPRADIPISDSHNWELVRKGMVGVIHDYRGTAHKLGIGLPFHMAGKTGTSQVFDRQAEDDQRDQSELPRRLRNHAWFIAYAPAEQPRIAIAVIAEHGGGGGRVAAPVARKVITSYLERKP